MLFTINKNMKITKLFLFNRSYMRQKMNRIQSKNHTLGSYRINKISLSSYDEKNIYS